MSSKQQSALNLPAGRQANLDALRVLSCFLVILIHVSGAKWGAVEMGTLQWQIFNIYSAVARCAVPLFVMMSGAAFLRRPQPVPLSELFRKYIAHLLVVYVFWAALYAVDEITLSALISRGGLKNLWQAILRPKYHLWFLPRLIGTYFLLPLFWPFVHYKDGKYVKYACLMALLLYFVPYTLAVIPQAEGVAPFLKQFEFPLNSFACYALLGYWLSTANLRSISNWLLLLAWTLSVAAAAAWNGWYALGTGNQDAPVYQVTTLPSCLEAMLMFLLFRNLSNAKIWKRCAGTLYILSRCTLGVYMLHVFVLEHLDRWFGVSSLSFQPLISIPLLSLAIFLLCLGVSALLRRIPLLGKWIV